MSAVNPLPQSEMAEQRHEPSMEEILASIRRIIADDQSLPGRLPVRETEPAAPPPQTVRDTPFAASAPPPMVYREPEPGLAATPPKPDHLSVDRVPREVGLAHGPISAPQFAMPHGPAGDDPVPEPPKSEPLMSEPSSAERPVPEALRAPSMEAHVVTSPIDPQPMSPVPEPILEPEAMPRPVHAADPAYPAPDVDVPASEERGPTQGDPRDTPPLFSMATNSAVSEAFNMLAASRLADNSDELMVLAREMIRPLLRTWIDDNLPTMVERLIRAEIERVARGGR